MVASCLFLPPKPFDPTSTKLERGVEVSEILTSFKLCENNCTDRDETPKIFHLRGRLQCEFLLFLLLPMISAPLLLAAGVLGGT